MGGIFVFDFYDYIVIFFALFGAYIIFGVAGFGTALIASPILALYMPLVQIVPLLALLDMSAACVNVCRDGRDADWRELRRLVPMMAVGSLIGAAILLRTRPDVLLLTLGIFVTAYALYSLAGFRNERRLPSSASIVFGIVGGTFSALFGSGGFLYAIYLSGRSESKEAMRVTQTTLIGLSTLTRVILFSLAGVYSDLSVLGTALSLAPGMLLGIAVGRRVTLKMSRKQFLNTINVVLLGAGIMLLARYFSRVFH